jgi:hypothetical protein
MTFMTVLVAYGVLYGVQAFIIYGLEFAYVQRKFARLAKESYREDMGTSLFLGIWLGAIPILGVLFVFLSTGMGQYGFKLR